MRHALVFSEVEDAQRTDEIASERGCKGLAVSDGQVVPDVVVRLALGVASAARVRGERLPEDCLGDLLVAISGEAFVQVRA